MTIQANSQSRTAKHQFAISTIAKFSGLDVENVSAEFERRFNQ